jgi:transposase-like protein
MLAEAKPDLLAFAGFPEAHWRKIWSTNPLERLNREIKRRCDVVGVFPNNTSVERLVTAVVLETHDEWAVSDRRYLSETSMAQLRSDGGSRQGARTGTGRRGRRRGACPGRVTSLAS